MIIGSGSQTSPRKLWWPIRADVEQQAVLLPLAAPRDQHGKSVAGAAQLVEDDLALMPIVGAARRRACGALNDLGNLRHALVHARQRVGLVVDHDEDFQLVERPDACRQ
jgi:hypothetical protein